MMTLEEAAIGILDGCIENGFHDIEKMQVLCLAEEVGEFVGAYRRWRRIARRNGSFNDVEKELADVIISAHVVAQVLGININNAIQSKLEICFSRGWKEHEVEGS